MKEYDLIVPDWAEPSPDMPRYDVDAKAAEPVPQEQMKLMLQRLLAERFQFVAHHEMRDKVHSVLRVAKGGPKLKEAAPVDAADASDTQQGGTVWL